MRLLDRFKSSHRDQREEDALHSLRVRLQQGASEKERFLKQLPFPELAGALVDYEGIFSPPPIPRQPDPAQTVFPTKIYQILLALRDTGQAESALRQLL